MPVPAAMLSQAGTRRQAQEQRLQRLDLHHSRHGLDGTRDLRRDFEAPRQFHFDFRAALEQEHDAYFTIAIGVG